ncbi:MAG: exopolysaccharide biosynthesis protein [Pseudomonadota bacterium]|uniref:exopolysaccharide biosynthesis protein n=1 Tax=Roseovarius TaxID=74030 RepID=UPI0022A8BAFE|nr:exopolysaccharide biosynthesis protein [Roseovarius sp. EGI FJ00037]MCZ0812650.1 exopolysaccharide biosynthesis protein [Roseovarius sp. EGI FJ00037]
MEVIDSAERALDGKKSSLGEVIDAIGHASYAPLLMVPALALVSPLSGVPGFTTVCGILIASVSAQMMLRRPTLWLPGWLRRRRMNSQRACQFVNWFRIPARWLDNVTRQRLSTLVTPPFSILPQAICLFLGAIMPLLELVPFTSSILGAVIGVLAAGMFVRDGLLVLAGMLLAALAVGGVASIF